MAVTAVPVAVWLGLDARHAEASHALLRAASQIGFEGIAALLAVVAALPRRGGEATRSQRAWRWIAAGISIDLVSSILWRVCGKPRISVFDLGFLSVYPCFMAALLALPRRRRADGAREGPDETPGGTWPGSLAQSQFWLDVATVGVSATMGIWYFVLAPLAGGSAGGPLQRAWLLAYPVGDVGLIFCLLPLLLSGTDTRSGRRSRAPLGLLGLGLGFFLTADLTYASMSLFQTADAERLPEVAYTLAYTFFALSSGAQRWAARGPQRAQSPLERLLRRLLQRLMRFPVASVRRLGARACRGLPYAAVAGAYALVLDAAADGGVSPAVAGTMTGAALLTVLVTLRQYAALRENARLLAERAEREAHFRHRAMHDPLTGLANRAQFEERLATALADFDESPLYGRDRRPAVLYLDLDDFKHVNDSLGHAVGDRLLGAVAARLLDATRGSDLVARLGGDEFAVLLGGVRHEDEARHVADRVVAAVRTPFVLGGVETSIGTSIGIALMQPGLDATELLRNADLAMYRAKQTGKHRHALFEPEMYVSAVERMMLLADLRRVLTAGDDAASGPAGELHVAYQPIVALDGGAIVGAEALARWTHPERGAIPPDTFIPLAEESELIHILGKRVLREACARAVEWRDRLAPTFTVSVNVSARELDDRAYVEFVAQVLRDTGLPPSALQLEVTESVVSRDPRRARGQLEALRAHGVRIAIDDFGTGHSSLSAVHALPIDALKIDSAFVQRLADDEGLTADGAPRRSAEARLGAVMVSVGEALGLPCVAEGVETAAQHEALRALGCRFAQGFHFARPVTADEMALQLRAPAAPPARFRVA